eukprot:gnl/TRDRNA2_/TRDRNA2_142638_c0_seq1.p1 gnl/TRDRNA2_/TRDRNA2_142638_c0~~gnl/TRDRNA2_/TRDRNA2_142638_c0_seq1.p1  ORF type:complete len:227 (+),score=43.53 gnl/TRDRNA2_/TRDRNA2_142638_c0_seq1:105-683(+)
MCAVHEEISLRERVRNLERDVRWKDRYDQRSAAKSKAQRRPQLAIKAAVQGSNDRYAACWKLQASTLQSCKEFPNDAEEGALKFSRLPLMHAPAASRMLTAEEGEQEGICADVDAALIDTAEEAESSHERNPDKDMLSERLASEIARFHGLQQDSRLVDTLLDMEFAFRMSLQAAGENALKSLQTRNTREKR